MRPVPPRSAQMPRGPSARRSPLSCCRPRASRARRAPGRRARLPFEYLRGNKPGYMERRVYAGDARYEGEKSRQGCGKEPARRVAKTEILLRELVKRRERQLRERDAEDQREK